MSDTLRPRPTGSVPADPALLRGLTSRRLSRRDALRGAGAGISAAWLASFLAACGTEGSVQEETEEDFWADKKQTGRLDFANWPLYIDKAGKRFPTLERFTKETGIRVNYREVIQENPSFYGRIQPQLAAGQGIGYDLIVMTNGIYVDKMLQQNFVIPVDHAQLPNFAEHADPALKNPSYDPGNKYTIPWQVGLTGICYNPKYIKRKITSLEDLFDPEFEGKIGMFADNLDLPNIALLSLGVAPEESTPEDWKRAADKLRQQRPLVRKYYEQGYIEAVSKGDIWITMTWSGDVFQSNLSNPGLGLEFVVPDEGALIWTDNMMIPIGAEHPVDALKMMNYVYDPDVAATIAEWVTYITPVPAAKDAMREHAREAKGEDRAYILDLIDSPLVFPTQEMLANVHRYRVLTADEEKEWNRLFEPIYQG